MVMTDEQIWQDAARAIHINIQAINCGAPFNKFNFIALHNIYMLTSFLYYQFNISALEDTTFDSLCKYLLDNYDKAVKVIRHPELTFTRDRLAAGTGYDLEMDAIWWNILLSYTRLTNNFLGASK